MSSLQVRIVKYSSKDMWYRDRIGDIFNVEDRSNEWYNCIDKSKHFIHKKDCIVLKNYMIKKKIKKYEEQVGKNGELILNISKDSFTNVIINQTEPKEQIYKTFDNVKDHIKKDIKYRGENNLTLSQIDEMSMIEQIVNINLDVIEIAEVKQDKCKECPLAEPLYKEWDTPEEDKAWKYLDQKQSKLDYDKLYKSMLDGEGKIWAYVTCGEEVKQAIQELQNLLQEKEEEIKGLNQTCDYEFRRNQGLVQELIEEEEKIEKLKRYNSNLLADKLRIMKKYNRLKVIKNQKIKVDEDVYEWIEHFTYDFKMRFYAEHQEQELGKSVV